MTEEIKSVEEHIKSIQDNLEILKYKLNICRNVIPDVPDLLDKINKGEEVVKQLHELLKERYNLL